MPIRCLPANHLTVAVALMLMHGIAAAQSIPLNVSSTDSVMVAAGGHYDVGGIHRFFLGGTYRNLWITPIRVPVLNLHTFDGGLKPLKLAGGFETKSLRLVTPDGTEYAFRSVDEHHGSLPGVLFGVGVVDDIAGDQTSSSHPGAALIVSALLDAAGVLQGAPVMVVMPDDTLLGKFRKDFAHVLGTIERYPTKAKGDRPGFANAVDVIDSDTLLQLINRNPRDRVDAPAFLAARLMDMLVNNWDRHPGQWKWARLEPHGGWEPISRDFDKAVISTGGVLPGIMRQMVPSLVTFDSTYPSVRALTWNSLDLDRRLLAGLAKSQWDSVAHALVRRITDSVIDGAVGAMPIEYRATAPALVAKLRFRRDSFPAAAERFYRFLAGVVDIHATDAADRATVTRVDDQFVDVRLESDNGEPYFARRFDARETSAIRLYLHGGNDQARIVGDVDASIPVRIIGGNDTNAIVDSSTVGGERNAAHLYDVGVMSGVSYGLDTLFDRRPMVRQFGGEVPPARDFGSRTSPIVDLTINHDLGIEPRLGMTWTRFGFRDEPYASMVSVQGRYSFKVNGFWAQLSADQRRESSALHFTEVALMSQLEIVNYHGLGNSSPETPGLLSGVSPPRTDYYAVNQRQWLFQPAIALRVGSTTELSFGPVLKYAVTDSLPDRFVSATRPYGFGNFGEAGLRLGLLHSDRLSPHQPHTGATLDLSATWYPGIWDVHTSFGVLNAVGAVYLAVPMPTHPYLTLRGGAKKVLGDFPFEESAFIGGRGDVRTFDPQRFAGDAAVFATAELRIPVAKVTFILPLNTGLLATEDIGRVYVNGDSPGGWHNAFGAGFWVAFHEVSVDVRVVIANEVGRAAPAALALGFALPGGFR